MHYRWQLRRGGKKIVCPRCGQNRFVPYVSTADGVTLAGAQYGRCDREQNCGYILYPSNDTPTPGAAAQPAPIQPPLVFHSSIVSVARSSLFDWTCKLIGVQGAGAAWYDYRIGATADGRTMFWQIDIDGVIRAGKAIKYRPDGHRDKNAFPPVNWAHKMPDYAIKHNGGELSQCFFGEHLLRDSTKKIIIVESEKTAAIMAQLFPEVIWLASGGSQNLKKLAGRACLNGRNVKLLPDNGQYWSWREIALKHNYDVSGYMEQHAPFEGADVLDVFEQQLLKRK